MPIRISQEGNYEIVPSTVGKSEAGKPGKNMGPTKAQRRRIAAAAVQTASMAVHSTTTTKKEPPMALTTIPSPEQEAQASGLRILPDPGIHASDTPPVITPRENLDSPANLAHVDDAGTDGEMPDAPAAPGSLLSELNQFAEQEAVPKGNASTTTDFQLEDGQQRFANLAVSEEKMAVFGANLEPSALVINIMSMNVVNAMQWCGRLMELTSEEKDYASYGAALKAMKYVISLVTMLNEYFAYRFDETPATYRFLPAARFPKILVEAKVIDEDANSAMLYDFINELLGEQETISSCPDWRASLGALHDLVNQNQEMAANIRVQSDLATGSVIVHLPTYESVWA